MTDLAPWLTPAIVAGVHIWTGALVALGTAVMIHSVCAIIEDWPDTTFDASYFWVRDASSEARAASEPMDCRDGADLARYTPWEQDPTLPVIMDCRDGFTADPGYVTGRPLDCRNV